MGPPPGGPEDETGPQLVSHYPEPGAVQVEQDMIVRLEFSELVNRSSVESAIFMSPDPLQRLRYKWSGKTLRLIYLDPLEDDRTYVVSVGSEAKDLRGNPAGKTTTIAFTTGEELDEGTFHGWVSGVEKLNTVSIWAFPIPIDRDPDPAIDTAAYRIQAGIDGSYSFSYLKEGPYRVFAVIDGNRDGFWNPAGEKIGPPPWDIVVKKGEDPWLSLLPQSFDTSAVLVHRIRHLEARRFELRLSRPVDSCRCELIDTMGNSIPTFVNFVQQEDSVYWTLFAADSVTPGQWYASCELLDPSGLRWSDLDTLDVTDKPDTTRPKLLRATPNDRDPVIAPGSVLLEFDEPIAYTEESELQATLTGAGDTTFANISLQGERFLAFLFPGYIEAAGRYTLNFDGTRFTDLSGNLLADTTIAYSFSVLSRDSLGSIVGTFESSLGGRYLATFYRLRDEQPFRAELLKPGEYDFPAFPAGKYRLQISHDNDRDSRLTPGGMFPFEFSEPFEMLPDTILVRARWESEYNFTWNPNQE